MWGGWGWVGGGGGGVGGHGVRVGRSVKLLLEEREANAMSRHAGVESGGLRERERVVELDRTMGQERGQGERACREMASAPREDVEPMCEDGKEGGAANGR